MTGVVYGSTTGNTGNVARKIAEKLGDAEVIEVASLKKGDLGEFDIILFGSSIWGVGELQDDWADRIDLLKSADFFEKKIGFFGCGDQEMYSDSFVDAIGKLYEAVKGSAGRIIGKWPKSGYNFSSSEAVVDDEFIGLAIDEDNQPELTDGRIDEWIECLK